MSSVYETHLKLASARNDFIISTDKKGKVHFWSYLLNQKWLGQKLGELPENDIGESLG